MSWESILFFFFGAHGIVLALLFILRPGSNKKRKYLGLYLLAFSITILHYVNYWEQVIFLPLFPRWIAVVSSWCMPVFLYFFFKPNAHKKEIVLNWMLPLFFTIFWLFIMLKPASIQFDSDSLMGYIKISAYAVYLYLFLRIEQKEKLDHLFIVSFALFTLGLILYRLSLFFGFYTLQIDYLICFTYIVFTYALTYYSQFDFLKKKAKPKYANSSLSEADGRELVQKVQVLLKESKAYSNPDFNLSLCAEELKVPKYRISQALNSFSGKSFSELINDFRVEEASKMLNQKHYDHLKLEAVGEAVGFKNKVSFYKQFRLRTGQTPGEYKASLTN